MSLPIRLRPEVVTDLTDAIDWYNTQRPGLGREFAQAAWDAIDALALRPRSFPLVARQVRRALMRRFPYAIYFRDEPAAVIILVVVHTARSPRVWKSRSR